MRDVKHRLRLGVLERFVITLGFLLLSLVITHTYAALALMLLLFSYLRLEAVSWRSLLSFLRIPIAFALIGLASIVLVLGANEPDTVLLISERFIPLSITVESLQRGEIVFWRAFNSLLSLYILIATTTVKEKNALADKLRIPGSLIELSVLSFRYIQLLDRKKKEIVIAQELRLGYSSYRKSFRSVALLLSSVFIYSISIFRQNYQALLTRGYSGTLYYSDGYDDLPKDRWWLITLTVLGVFVLVVLYQMFLR